jgi:imidazolonepropionase-like amidohydrolase
VGSRSDGKVEKILIAFIKVMATEVDLLLERVGWPSSWDLSVKMDQFRIPSECPFQGQAGGGRSVATRRRRFIAGAYFDGERHHNRGPYAFVVDQGKIVGIEAAAAGDAVDYAFLLPSLVDAHVHLFLDGAELDQVRRKAAMTAGVPLLLETALANAKSTWEAGISLVRDGGDPHGINYAVRSQPQCPLRVRASGTALHRPGCYGSFLGPAIAYDQDIVATVAARCEQADDVKVLLTGVIDFDSGTVKGDPQFDLQAARAIVETAHTHGRPAFAHCNGHAGLAIAIQAGFDSVEHGYLMDEESLRAMAGEGVAWTPTLVPVAVQLRLDPAINGFTPEVVEMLERIVASHAASIARAAQLGVPLLCGSDAGGQGVPHGSGLIDEMLLMASAGAPMEVVLKAATSLPRARWGEPPATIAMGSGFDVLGLPASPFADPGALRQAFRLLPGLERAEMEK